MDKMKHLFSSVKRKKNTGLKFEISSLASSLNYVDSSRDFIDWTAQWTERDSTLANNKSNFVPKGIKCTS